MALARMTSSRPEAHRVRETRQRSKLSEIKKCKLEFSRVPSRKPNALARHWTSSKIRARRCNSALASFLVCCVWKFATILGALHGCVGKRDSGRGVARKYWEIRQTGEAIRPLCLQPVSCNSRVVFHSYKLLEACVAAQYADRYTMRKRERQIETVRKKENNGRVRRFATNYSIVYVVQPPSFLLQAQKYDATSCTRHQRDPPTIFFVLAGTSSHKCRFLAFTPNVSASKARRNHNVLNHVEFHTTVIDFLSNSGYILAVPVGRLIRT